MKNFTLFSLLFAFVLVANAQTHEIVFEETCGATPLANGVKPKITEHKGWDNGAPVTFTYTTTDYADVRTTSALNNHIWFSATRTVDVVISNISITGYEDLKLSFDLASNKGTPSEANTNKFAVYCNDVAVTVPSVAIPEVNKYVNSGEISLTAAGETMKIRFLIDAVNNPTGYGYRLDNIKVTGVKSGSNIQTNTVYGIKTYVSGDQLKVENAKEGSVVQIYTLLGEKVNHTVLENNIVDIQNLQKGVYLLFIGSHSQRILIP